MAALSSAEREKRGTIDVWSHDGMLVLACTKSDLRKCDAACALGSFVENSPMPMSQNVLSNQHIDQEFDGGLLSSYSLGERKKHVGA